MGRPGARTLTRGSIWPSAVQQNYPSVSHMVVWHAECHFAGARGRGDPGGRSGRRPPLSPARGEPRRGCFGLNDRMVVIFGFGAGSPEDQGEVAPWVCPNCHNQVFLHHVRSKKSVRLYFVPVVPYGTDDYLVCPVCSRGLQITDAQLRHVRPMSRATASFRAAGSPRPGTRRRSSGSGVSSG